MLTGSRAGVLLAGGVVLFQIWADARMILGRDHRSRWVQWAGRIAPALALALASAGLALAYLRDESVAGMAAGLPDFPRLQRIGVYVEAWLKEPLLGHGLGEISRIRDASMTLDNVLSMRAAGDAQNAVLRWLVEGGLAGAAIALLAAVAAVLPAARSLGKPRMPRTYARLTVAAGLLLALHGVADSSLDLPSALWLFAFSAGAATGTAYAFGSTGHRSAPHSAQM